LQPFKFVKKNFQPSLTDFNKT